MKKVKLLACLLIIGSMTTLNSCKKEKDKVKGCTDPTSKNYNPNATEDDGSCIAKVCGCTDPTAFNYNPAANTDNGSCIAKVYGCTDPDATNYNPAANTDNGTCQYTGHIIFWYDSGGTNATVYIGGHTGTINGSYYYTSAPACGSLYCANFTLPIGTYSFTASSTYHDWSGNATVTTNGCTAVLLP